MAASADLKTINKKLITGLNNRVATIRELDTAIDVGSDIVLSTVGSNDPTNGDGTLRVIIRYKVVTFGQ